MHLDTSGGSSPRRTETLVVHRCAPPPTIRLHGVTMVEPLTALQEIAGRLTLDELVIAIDSLVADRFGTAWRIPLSEVREQAEAARGRGGGSSGRLPHWLGSAYGRRGRRRCTFC